MAPASLPITLPGKTIQIAYVPSASPDWQDALYLQDDGSSWHVYYRNIPGVGWQYEQATKAG